MKNVFATSAALLAIVVGGALVAGCTHMTESAGVGKSRPIHAVDENAHFDASMQSTWLGTPVDGGTMSGTN